MQKISSFFKSIGDFIITNWIIILFVMTIIALVMLLSIVISFIKERNRSDSILNSRAYEEYELYRLKSEEDGIAPSSRSIRKCSKSRKENLDEEDVSFEHDMSAFD